MLVYNVTTKVDWSIADHWVTWMLDYHIPGVIGTGCFIRHQFVRLLETDESEGPTYAVQYFAESKIKYEEYINHYANQFRQQSMDQWGESFIAFRSLMEVIS